LFRHRGVRDAKKVDALSSAVSDVVEAWALMETRLRDVEKQVEATRRKVYRDEGKGNGTPDTPEPLTQAAMPDFWANVKPGDYIP